MSGENITKPIRVCFVMPKAYPLFNPSIEAVFGGSEVDLYYLATELARDRNFHVSFIVADYGQPEGEIRQNVRLIKSLNLKQNPMLGAWRIWQALSKADSHIYMLKTASPGTALTAYFCKNNQKIFLYRIAHRYECDGTCLRKHPILGKAFVWSLRQAQIVFSQNSDDSELLKNTTGVSSQLIPNGHSLPEITQDNKRDIILWVGRTADFKQPQLFSELARHLKNEQFTMICQKATDDKDYMSLRKEAEQIKNLTFIKRVGFAEIDGYFRRAKVLVNTSEAEGFPNTFIQAGKWATPILSLNVNPDGFLDKYGCGLCAAGDWDKFVKMLGELLDPATAQRYGRNGRRYAEENHDIKKIVEEYKTIFRRLVGGMLSRS